MMTFSRKEWARYSVREAVCAKLLAFPFGTQTGLVSRLRWRRYNAGARLGAHSMIRLTGHADLDKAILILALTALVTFAGFSAVTIGPEALVALPSSALYHC